MSQEPEHTYTVAVTVLHYFTMTATSEEHAEDQAFIEWQSWTPTQTDVLEAYVVSGPSDEEESDEPGPGSA